MCGTEHFLHRVLLDTGFVLLILFLITEYTKERCKKNMLDKMVTSLPCVREMLNSDYLEWSFFMALLND